MDIKEAKTENDIEDNQSYYSIGNPEKNEGIQDEEYSIPIYIHIDTADMEQGYYYVSLNGKYEFIMYLNELKNEDIDTTITLTTRELPDDASAAQSSFALAKVNLDNLTKLHEILSQNTIDTSYSDGKAITSSINTNKSGMLYISLPFNNNWEITVDGQHTEAMPLLGGIGINIQEGSHQVVLRYNPNGLYEGIIISVSTLLILFLLIIYKKKKNTKSEK